MSIKMQDVRAHLELDEPDYATAAEMGPDALPFLDKLVEDKNAMLASKATYLASLIKHHDAAGIVRHAATHADPIVRLAAAAAAKNIAPEDANDVLEPLVGDRDSGVRKVAINSIPDTPSRSLRDRLQTNADDEADPDLRTLCRDTLSRIGAAPLTPAAATTSTSRETVPNESSVESAEEDDGAGMGGGEFDNHGDNNMTDLRGIPDPGMGGGELMEHSAEQSTEFDDPAEFGGGDGSIDIADANKATTTDAENDGSDGFGGGGG